MSEALTISNSRYPYWFITPINGISIQAEEGPPALIFKDATILAPAEVAIFFEWCDTQGWKIEDLENFKKELHYHSGVGSPHAFLVVGSFTQDSKENTASADRAKQIAESLCAIILHFENCNRDCKLHSELISYPQYSSIEIKNDFGVINQTDSHISTDAHIVLTLPQRTFKRNEFLDLLLAPHVRSLTEELLLKQHRLTGDLRKTFSKAVRHVYWTHDALTPEVQVVGAVTALEVLFGVNENTRSDGFEKVKKRLEWFIGAVGKANVYESFVESKLANGKTVDIFDLRHSNVHRADTVTHSAAFKAVHLVVSILPLYVEFARNFKTTQELFAYIDMARSLQHFKASSMEELLQRWQEVPEERQPLDAFRPFLLNQWFGERGGVKIPNPPTREEKFTHAVLVLQSVYRIDIEEAFQQAIQYSIHPSPFSDIEQLKIFLSENSQIEQKARETVEILTENGHLKYYVPSVLQTL